ncbi:hypothetical protein [Maribellus sp. YY47]|uniref:TolB family protein n=1 Tax=Maribellus sp. YY47 TaxID=2929486 RepID=UPI002000E24B|nr:hypothetical protein [Maribellus sp. YY47]MCK3683414.1 hypothetical protein [Maribellus sp. YY47]
MNQRYYWIYFFPLLLFISCTSKPDGEVLKSEQPLKIYPDYSEIELPSNIAPMNFVVEDNAEAYYLILSGEKGGLLEVSSRNGEFCFSKKKWAKLLAQNSGAKINYQIYIQKQGEWYQYPVFSNNVSTQKVDPFLYYRLLYPGYESWTELSIVQRSLESFQEKTVIENNVVGQNCVNCHAFNAQNPDNFMFHMRGNLGGTYFVENGNLKKVNLKTKEMENGTVYPRWHPSGKYVAYASNKVVQQFHAMDKKKIEVSDLNSSLLLYDIEKNELLQVPVDPKKQFMDTYPEWSPDGQFLYFCRAAQIGKAYFYEDIKYDLWRVSFDPESRQFGSAERIFDANAIDKSVSFPRISPDGKLLVFTLHNYGCFPIWHKEADLFALNLDDHSCNQLELNSEFTESYHSWSSNGKWLVFSSKRGDGLTARPYISYVNDNGKASKPFVLPQENPLFYKDFIKTYNIPEFAQSDVSFSPGTIRRAADKKAIQAAWSSK